MNRCYWEVRQKSCLNVHARVHDAIDPFSSVRAILQDMEITVLFRLLPIRPRLTNAAIQLRSADLWELQ